MILKVLTFVYPLVCLLSHVGVYIISELIISVLFNFICIGIHGPILQELGAVFKRSAYVIKHHVYVCLLYSQ